MDRCLACGFVDAHIGWAIHAEQVDCRACRLILGHGAPAAPDASWVPARDPAGPDDGGPAMPVEIEDARAGEERPRRARL